MKKIIALCLALAMAFSMTACGCKHGSAKMKLTNIDTTALTAKWEVSCAECGEFLETRDADTGVAPENGVFRLSPQDWFACLSTNIKNFDTTGSLIPIAADPQDDALLYSVLSMSGLKTAISFFDAQDNVLTTQQAAQTDIIHRIRVEAQFDNANALQFYALLVILARNNNSTLESEAGNALGQQVMSGTPVTDNGYRYTMEILSVADHTVAVHIVAE